jgi:hypothetical protein
VLLARATSGEGRSAGGAAIRMSQQLLKMPKRSKVTVSTRRLSKNCRARTSHNLKPGHSICP